VSNTQENVATPSLSIAGIRGILLDIEGTTTPIAFVHEVLFSYARSQVRNYLVEHFGSTDPGSQPGVPGGAAPLGWQTGSPLGVVDLDADFAQLHEEHAADLKQNLRPPALVDGPRGAKIDSIVAYVGWLMDRDRKSTGLKSLQGKIWRQGYLDGTLKAQLFSDVAPALERWRRSGLKISIFSSGSSLAQKLLFAHTEAGDLTRFISNYFDTTVGSKTDVESYRQIAAALVLPATEVLFISDVVSELDAANAAGMQTLLCVRPSNQSQSLPARYQIIQSFKEISESGI
jgi:enolase-phosphatase E1